MFTWLARFILRNRRILLVVISLITIVMAYKAFDIKLSYDFAKVLPDSDPDYIAYERFKQTFGEDGSVMVMGIRDKNLYELEKFNDWWQLGNEIKKIDGIEAVVSVAHIYNIRKNSEQRKFELLPVMKQRLSNQEEVDRIRNEIDELPFYRGFLFNPETGATVMAVTFDKQKLNTKNRFLMIDVIRAKAEAFSQKHHLEMHYSGLPYIRTAI